MAVEVQPVGRADIAPQDLAEMQRRAERQRRLCRPLGRSVLISGAVAAETITPLVPLGEHALRGIAAPCTVFALPDA